jgi:TRAP-type C4-dicarboxylate transport system permease large subunit
VFDVATDCCFGEGLIINSLMMEAICGSETSDANTTLKSAFDRLEATGYCRSESWGVVNLQRVQTGIIVVGSLYISELIRCASRSGTPTYNAS